MPRGSTPFVYRDMFPSGKNISPLEPIDNLGTSVSACALVGWKLPPLTTPRG